MLGDVSCGLRAWVVVLGLSGLVVGCERPEPGVPPEDGGMLSTSGGGEGEGDGGTQGSGDSGGTSGDDTGTGATDGDRGGTGREPDPQDCPDGDDDGDGVCNGQDNCAGTANPDQADSDNDGKGDACAPACDLAPESQVGVGSAFAGGVDLNASGQNRIVVAPGAEVRVDYGYATAPCMPFTTDSQFIVVGFDAGEGAPDCGTGHSCVLPDPPSCAAALLNQGCTPSEPATATLTAPAAPGEYYIVVEHRVGDSCDGWSSGPPTGSDVRIGGVCVRE